MTALQLILKWQGLISVKKINRDKEFLVAEGEKLTYICEHFSKVSGEATV